MRIVLATETHRDAVPARHAARLLEGLYTVWAGTVIALDPDASAGVLGNLRAGIAEAVGAAAEPRMAGPMEEMPVVGVVLRDVERVGRAMLEGEAWPEASVALQTVVTGSLLRRWDGGDSFAIARLGAGSVYMDIEIARDLERATEAFARIVRKVGSLLAWHPGARPDEVQGAVRDVVPPGPAARAGAGVIGVGIPQVVAAAAGLGGRELKVE